MSVRFALAGVVVLALAACASTSRQPAAATTPVKVIVTTAPSIDKVIDARKTTAQTELWLSELAPDATPATVTLHFTGTTLVSRRQLALGAEVHGNPEPVTYTRVVASLSPTPWLDGFEPVIAATTVPAGSFIDEHELAVRGTYTITGTDGATLEEGPVITPPGDNQRELAWMVARRVRDLTRSSR